MKYISKKDLFSFTRAQRFLFYYLLQGPCPSPTAKMPPKLFSHFSIVRPVNINPSDSSISPRQLVVYTQLLISLVKIFLYCLLLKDVCASIYSDSHWHQFTERKIRGASKLLTMKVYPSCFQFVLLTKLKNLEPKRQQNNITTEQQ